MDLSPQAKLHDVAAELTETLDTLHESVDLVGKDKAARLLEAVGHSVVVTPQDNIRLSRRIDVAILPIILVIYCLQSLDKTALAYASVFGLIEDAGLHGEDFVRSACVPPSHVSAKQDYSLGLVQSSMSRSLYSSPL
nr:putative transporter [Quercus suber]